MSRRPARTQRAFPLVGIILGVTTALTLVVYDPRAQAPFDAPKRLVAMIGIAIAVFAWAAVGSQPPNAARRRAPLACVAGALLLAIGSALASPHREVALDSVRAIVVFAALPFLCALTTAWSSVSFGFIAGAAINAVLSLLQWSDAYQPFQYVTIGGRAHTSALVGNTGMLAIVLAFAVVLLLPRLLRQGRSRIIAASLLVIFVVAIAGLRSVTALAVLGTGVIAFTIRSAGRRRMAMIAVVCVLLAGASAWVLTVRGRELSEGVRSWNRMLTYRLAPWGAAVEMFLDRPLLGWGPGTFAAEFAPHFIDAELRWKTRLADPTITGSYAEAHGDVLQSLAELGGPATLLILAAVALVTRSLLRTDHPDAPVVLAVIVGGLVATLAWFPMLRPTTAILLLATTGYAWRISS